MPGQGTYELLEREAELASVAALIDRAKDGVGRLVVIEARTGMGKTRLLGEAREAATRAGLRVLAARGGELEHEFSYGIVRQLFEPALAGVDAAERAELLEGAAAHAAPLFDPAQAPDAARASGDASFSSLHGLYWLTANLAARSALLLAIDDVHWADASSLRFLAYLVRRLEGLPVIVVVGVRPEGSEPHPALLAEIVNEPAAVVVRPASLTAEAVAGLVRETLSPDADEDFCEACRAATGGNPLLLRELLTALAAEGVEPTGANAAKVEEVGPEAVARAVRARLARLPSEALALAQAVAVLGADVSPAHAAALAELDREAAAHAATTLGRADVLTFATPLEFVHPVVRSAVYAEIDPATRVHRHAQAARILAEAGAGPDQVAAHLLLAPPAGDPWVVETLRQAARRSRSEGSADVAVTYLCRALEEPPPAEATWTVLFELGNVERLVHGPSAIEHLGQALGATTDPERRAQTALVLGRTLYFAGRREEAVDVFDRALAEVPRQSTELRLRLHAAFLNGAIWEPELVERTAERVEEVRAASFGSAPAGRMLLAILAFYDARAGGSRGDATDAAERALAGGLLLAEEDSAAYAYAGMVLSVVDRFDDALRMWDEVLALARARGSVLAFATASSFRAKAAQLAGRLYEAEADARNAADAAASHGLEVGLPWAVSFLADALLDRGDLDGAETALARLGVGDELPTTGHMLWFLDSRARLRMLRGQTREALDDLLELGRRYEQLGARNPALLAWRSSAALAYHELGDRDRARSLAAEEVELARRWAAPRALGRALRAAGLVEGGARGLALLEESVAVLEGSPAVLERARSLTELGAALKRAKRRSDARELLRQGLELAHGCGAAPVAERAHTELLSTGARPRRLVVSGRESLTPSELRVAEMAAEGQTNREIAQRLFVTPKTVEVHLSNTYRKLGIQSRSDLRDALGAPEEASPPEPSSEPGPSARSREWWRSSGVRGASAGAGEAALRRYLSGRPVEAQPILDGLPAGMVTFLFTDIEGSTRLLEELGETYRRLLSEHHELIRSTAGRRGGHVLNVQGDAFFLAFGNAADAVAAAVEAQRTIQSRPWPGSRPLRVRMGLHSGEQTPTEEGYVGLDVHRGARICSAGHGGQVLLSEATRALVAEELPEGVTVTELGEHRLKDLTRPERLHQLVVEGLPREFPSLRTLEGKPTNLPIQPTPLVGRAREVAEACDLLMLDGARLLTLTGPGGAGKTRLALQVAVQLLDGFADGVFFVPLAAIDDERLVPAAIARALGIGEEGGEPVEDRLRDYLRERQLLLVLDNFEQVVAAAPFVADLLTTAPRLQLLVTSRSLLRLSAERELPVPPLAQAEALELFVERAQAVDPRFQITDENAPAVAAICARLEGLPLAIELAAARTKLLPPDALLARLRESLDLLSGVAHDMPERHRTLRAAVRWSYDNLEPSEQRLFARLAVFVGGCTVEAAEAACGADEKSPTAVLDGLEALAGNSLLRRDERPGEPRFLMLETIRELARERLDESGEADAVRERHARYYAGLAESAFRELSGPRQDAWLDRLDSELDNLRAAVLWSIEQPSPEAALRILGSTVRFWEARARFEEVREWLDAALPRSEGIDPLVRARAARLAGRLDLFQSDFERAIPFYELALELFAQAGDDEGHVLSLTELAWMTIMRGDLERGRAMCEEGFAAAGRLGDRGLVGNALNNLGVALGEAGDAARASELFAEALAARREVGDRRGETIALSNLGVSQLREGKYAPAQETLLEAVELTRSFGDPIPLAYAIGMLGWARLLGGEEEEAEELFRESLRMRLETGEKRFTADNLEGLAAVAAAQDRPRRAARLFGAADALLSSIGAELTPADREVQEPFVERARRALGEQEWESAFASGRELPLDRAVEVALASTPAAEVAAR
jgi:predicted ATPase/class 3 adenylate cyclase/ATP/maltotriose-dependent transcriptional regulator MalT